MLDGVFVGPLKCRCVMIQIGICNNSEEVNSSECAWGNRLLFKNQKLTILYVYILQEQNGGVFDRLGYGNI